MSAPAISADEVRRIARLARLALTDDETARLTVDLVQIIEFVSQLKALPLPEMAPASAGAPDDLREDRPRPGLDSEAALGPAPAVERRHFVVPPVVGE